MRLNKDFESGDIDATSSSHAERSVCLVRKGSEPGG